MSRVATRRLIDASATLDESDRALLNIWVTRGLDGAAVARMTGLSEKAIADRRIRIVEHLSSVLNLPDDYVRNALNEITASSDARPAASTPASHSLTPQSGRVRRRRLDVGAASQRRRWLWGVAAVITIVVAVVLVLSLASNGPGRHSTTTEARVPASPGSSSRTPAATPAPPAARLVALPGGLANAAGSVRVTGQGPTRKLDVSVSGLPPLPRGRYVAWLYTSLVNSERLGKLPRGTGQESLRVPSNARRYAWIDISYQPPGVVFHSGDSLLRAANPLHAR